MRYERALWIILVTVFYMVSSASMLLPKPFNQAGKHFPFLVPQVPPSSACQVGGDAVVEGENYAEST